MSADAGASPIDTRTQQQVQAALQSRRPQDARRLLQSVLAADPADHEALRAMAGVCAALGDIDGAIDHLQKLIRRTPEALPLINELAQFCLRHGRLETAVQAYQRYLSTHADSASGQFNCAFYLARLGRWQPAIDHYSKALGLGIDRPEEVHVNIANAYADGLRDDARARKHLERALALNPGYAGALHNLGNLAEQQGARDEARRCFQRCLELDPGNVLALARLADAEDFGQGNDELFDKLVAAAAKSADADLHFALGRAYEQRGDYDQAWRHFTAANRQDRSLYPAYDPRAVEQSIDRLIATCSAEWLARLQADRAPTEPVFICGMFRSGSTLVEQILAAHPAFTPAGEREFFPRLVLGKLPRYPEGLESLSAGQVRSWAKAYARESAQVFGTATRLTDKRPDNFLFVGLIKALFPKARVVITRRDWRDVALSVYATRLGPIAHYATNLANTRHYIGQHDRLVAHWQSLLGDDLVSVQYEDIIANPRQAIERLLAALGEPWDERCLDFHQVGNTVRTASVWQVRRPLYASSVGRWTHYREQFVAAFGDSVEQRGQGGV